MEGEEDEEKEERRRGALTTRAETERVSSEAAEDELL